MAQYPEHLVREHRLPDGTPVIIRPIRPDDAEEERAFLERLSEESRYMRFQKWVGAPSDNLIHFLSEVDYDRHLALVGVVPREHGEELVGEARYVINPDGKSCEFGIMIADAWQKSGIAGLLMDALMRAAHERGLTSMQGLVLSSNFSMLRFAHALGFQASWLPEDRTTMRIEKKL